MANVTSLSCSKTTISSSKPQFGRWLIEQVGSGLYEGLRWVSKNKFRIPWKHNSRKDCSDEDCKIFMAWAVISGKIHENPHDKAKWKTNFRCALNGLKQFDMVEDHSKESDDPHKVYQIIQTGNYEDQNNQNILNTNPSLMTQEGMEQEDMLSDIVPLKPNNQPAAGDPQWSSSYPINSFHEYSNQPMIIDIHPRSQNQIPVMVQEPYCPVNDPVIYHPGGLPSVYDLEITIYYRKKEMQRVTVSGPQVQLHYKCEDMTLAAQSICFPGTEHILDRHQVNYTEDILSTIQRGLLLKVQPTGIYGLRQDRCRVFACTGNPAKIQHPQPNKLPQYREVELLNFDKFKQDLIEFQENKSGSPDYTLYLCFGEAFPDGKSLDKKLITVKVVPLICQYFHEKAQMDGASSIQSEAVSLQFSHNSLYDLINSIFSPPTTY